MALNSCHTADGGIIIHQGEMILLHSANALISFSGSDQLKFGEKAGNVYLTTHRLIFLAGKGGSQNNFKSFSFPFCVLSQVEVEQPVFGANFLKGKVRAQPDGGFTGEAKFKLIFRSGGAIEFAQGMMRAMQIARRMNSESQAWNEAPPSYTQTMSGNNYMPAPANYYQGPMPMYGWLPPAYNFSPPENGTVYISDAPPPYPGMTTAQPNYQQQPAFNPYGTGVPQPQYNQQYNPYPPAQNGFAYANGTQAFIPPEMVPPSYTEAVSGKKTN